MKNKIITACKKFVKKYGFSICMMTLLLVLGGPQTAFAADAIKGKFTTFTSLVSVVVQSIGSVVLIWAAFEFGNSMQQQEGGATTRSLRMVGGALVMLIAPSIATALMG